MIIDSATPILTSLAQISHGYAVDALGHASLTLQSAMQKKARGYGASRYGFDFKNGKRVLRGSNQAGTKGDYFNRFNRKTGQKEHGLDQFIKFQVSEIYLYSVIGFINMKGHNAALYRNGKKVGSKFVKGQGKAASMPNPKNIKEIGQMMEYGGREKLNAKQRGLFKASGWGVAARKGYVDRQARPVVNPTFRAMSGRVYGIMNEKYGKALAKHIRQTSATPKVIK